MVGWDNESTTDWTTADRLQAVAAKQGYDIRMTARTAADIDQLAEDVSRLRQLLYFLAGLCHPVMRESAPTRPPARLLMVDADGRVQRAPSDGG